MLALNELKTFARQAAILIAGERDLAAFEVYCSSSEHIVARLNYTSDIPCSGVEEAKSMSADGFAIRIVSAKNRYETGVAFEAGDLSVESVRGALARARRARVVDPHFPGLPAQPRRLAVGRQAVGDLIRAGAESIVTAAWQIVRDAIDTFTRRAPAVSENPGLIIGGDLSLIRDRVAIASSNFDDIRGDQGAHFSSSVTALVESLEAKGTASASGTSLAELRRVVPTLGRDAVDRALRSGRGERPAAGEYRVLLGPQPKRDRRSATAACPSRDRRSGRDRRSSRREKLP